MYSEHAYPIKIPTWENEEWSTTVFNTQVEFREYILTLFKEPGQYEFDEHIRIFNEQAFVYNAKEYYCTAPFKSRDYLTYWDDQKDKNRMGVIIKGNNKEWYVTRDYYMQINFLPIFDKELNDYLFPRIWDVQYHMALYECLAELFNKHAAILKKRQIASSYFHCAKLINQYWFEKGAKLKMGASLKDYINEKGSWKFLQEYAAFLQQ